MTFNLSVLNFYDIIINLIKQTNLLYTIVNNDINTTINLFNLSYITENKINNDYTVFYLDNYCNYLFFNNLEFTTLSLQNINIYKNNYYILYFILKFFKIIFFSVILYTIFFITKLEHYIKQIKMISLFTKLFILNATEKEVGPVDDYFFFAILFMLVITLFIFSTIFLLIIQNNIFIWTLGGLFLIIFLILSLPINLFIDFGINFCVVARGSALTNNFLKEIILDIISVMIVFIRFIIQNIRFLFIFFGIFELLEWTISFNSNLFISSIYINSNIFYNLLNTNFFLSVSNFNYLLINILLQLILYFYYLLHLLFLLLVQITIYIGISLWLFFFLYSTKFNTKFDNFFSSKSKIN